MLYKNVKVEEVNVVIYLREKAVDNWAANERIVLDWLNKSMIEINVGIENPVDDMVYLYFLDVENVNIKLLTEVYKEAEKEFEEVKVNLYLDGCIDGDINSVDLSLDEFLKLLEE